MNIIKHRKMDKKYLATGYLATAGLVASALMMPAAQADGFEEAITGGKAKIDMRLRYEAVDDSVNKKAKAATLRTRMGYQTGDFKGLFAYGEFEDVRTAGLDDYAPTKAGYATIADPAITELNRAFIGFKGIPDSIVKVGRQRIKLDNDRFIGNVGWRQDEQTFDAFRLVNTSLPNTTVTYAYLDKVNGILPKFDADVTDHLLNASYSGFKPAKITGYAYLLEDDDSKAKNDSYGLRVKGKTGLSSNSKLLYTAEYASQSTNNNDATYTFLEGGVKYAGVVAKVGYEVLGSDSGAYGFQTPLATKHAMNGWADMFLVTPTNGLQDVMLTLTTKVAGVKLLGVYHDYSADQGSANYGSEINLLAAKKFAKRYTLAIKYANYSADTWKADTSKLWIWGQLKI